MNLALNHMGQIALPVADADRSERFYADVLKLRKLFRFGGLCFFDCGGVRLLLDRAGDPADIKSGAVVYFRVADLMLATKELEDRGVVFVERPHLVARMEDHDFWLAAFRDPDGHLLALMQEAPKGYAPPA